MEEQIERDLVGHEPKKLDRFWDAQKALGNPWALVRFQISGSKVRAQSIGDYTATSRPRIPAVFGAIKRLASHVPLRAADFLVSMHDALDEREHEVPIFVFAKNQASSSKTILIPDFEALKGNWHMFPQIARGQARFPWEKKIEKAVFRGAMTGGGFNASNFESFPRSRVVRASLDHPDLIDGRYTQIVQVDSKEEIERLFSAYFGPKLSVEGQLKYKYQLLIDGNSAAYSRAFWQFHAGAAILKQESDHIQWYYAGLKANEHYLPIKPDLSDLSEQVKWARGHDEEMRRLAQNAGEFAKQNLSYMRIYQYLLLVLTRYGDLQREV